VPTEVAFGPDHSIWTLGGEWWVHSGKRREYFVLQNYSQDGNRLGAYLPRSGFSMDDEPAPGVMWRGGGLRVSGNRIGATLYTRPHSSLLDRIRLERARDRAMADRWT